MANIFIRTRAWITSSFSIISLSLLIFLCFVIIKQQKDFNALQKKIKSIDSNIDDLSRNVDDRADDLESRLDDVESNMTDELEDVKRTIRIWSN